MTSLEQLHAKLKETHGQRDKIFEQIKPLQEKVSSLSKKITDLTEAITVETLKTEQSEQDRFDFLMAESGSGLDHVRYNAANLLIHDMGLYMSGYCQFSQQKAVHVFVFKFDDARNEQIIASIKKLSNLLKPMDAEGNKHFKVFCKDPVIFAHADGTFSLRSGNGRSRHDFSTLEELFVYYVANRSCYDDEDENNDD